MFCVLFAGKAYSEDKNNQALQEVQVADPFLELHTGAAVGYPVFYVVDRDEWITIIKRRTDWFNIRTRKGKEGWVHRSQMVKTLTPTGETMKIIDVTKENYLERNWEMGMIGGDFGGAAIMTFYGGYNFTPNLSAEVSLSQVLGNFSSSMMINVDLVAQPFPEWKVSPYFMIGTGVIRVSPRSTLAQPADRTDQIGHYGIGVKMYLTRRFLLRAEYRSHVVFQSRDDNEEIDSWQIGFGIFF